jgi:hypothetical protein
MVTFSSQGKNYIATESDVFMDNGVKIVYIKGGKTANPTATRIEVGNNEWHRIMPKLNPIDYEAYYGRKPALSGISIYQVKKQM